LRISSFFDSGLSTFVSFARSLRDAWFDFDLRIKIGYSSLFSSVVEECSKLFLIAC